MISRFKGAPCQKYGHHFGRTNDGHCIECERLRGLDRFSGEYHDRHLELALRSKRRAKARRTGLRAIADALGAP